jgi:alkaline phosphatase
LFLAATLLGALTARAGDRIKDLQTVNVASAKEKASRAYHFGSQGPGDVFSNHTSHSNRLIPVYVFGRKPRLDAVTGKNSLYRDPAKLQALFGFLPENTVNPEADYADQSDLYRVQRDAVARGVKHLFIVWFDGMDWPTTQAAAIVKSGKVYTEGKGAGLIFQGDPTGGSARFGYYVTTPTYDTNTPNLEEQTVVVGPGGCRGGYDARIGGPNPWKLGPLGAQAPGYFKGQSADAKDKAGVQAVGGVIHAYTDSSTSAGEFVTGVKAYNSGVNDVVLGTGFGQTMTDKTHKAQGKNSVKGHVYIADADKEAIDVRNGGRYVVVQTERGVNGSRALRKAAETAAERGERLFGFFGSKTLGHLPYRTADGRYDPAPDIDGKAEMYTQADLDEQPTLAGMTRAALRVLGSRPDRPFALFVEAGDVDFALHKNNLDNAIGAVYSGEEAIGVIVDWVAKNSNWDDSMMIVTADHGHYLVIDDPNALIGTR